jgi:transposase
LFWLNDRQWAVIEPLLPRLGGKPRVDDRRVISGILHRYREGLRWRTIPAEYGPRTTLFNRFNRWSERGLWQQLFAALAACDDPPVVAMRQHRHARAPCGRRRQRGQRSQVIGRSRGGPTTIGTAHLLSMQTHLFSDVQPSSYSSCASSTPSAAYCAHVAVTRNGLRSATPHSRWICS